MKRKLLAVVMALVAVFTFSGTAFAWWDQYPEGDYYYCSHVAGAHFCLFENTGGSGDNLVSNQSLSDLGALPHEFTYHCARGSIWLEDDWNDCVSSMRVWLPSTSWRVCVYRNVNYQSLDYFLSGYQGGTLINAGGSTFDNDAASSVRLTTGTC